MVGTIGAGFPPAWGWDMSRFLELGWEWPGGERDSLNRLAFPQSSVRPNGRQSEISEVSRVASAPAAASGAPRAQVVTERVVSPRVRTRGCGPVLARPTFGGQNGGRTRPRFRGREFGNGRHIFTRQTRLRRAPAVTHWLLPPPDSGGRAQT